ncbi:CASP-like protein 4B1 [Rhododendron vialii]|uniref:CASP-like protein 4B1 n=1 Tax=Rhododendron vialii TaxID=182163 RepID=UPI00265F9DC6|nr:CASP-like protein 4B1 [Rhododendron vialii]
MTSTDDPIPTKTASSTSPELTAPPARNVENQTPASGFGAPGIRERWRTQDQLKIGSLALRGLGFLFSFLAFIIMATNNHGSGENFDNYEEYRYVLAIAIMSTIYTVAQLVPQVHELFTGRQLFPPRNLALLDFLGDQIMAYLLISALSSAIPQTNRMREQEDTIFTDNSAAAISMEFFAFLALAFSALISGYKLSNDSNQSYV